MVKHETTVTEANGHTPASAECSCGWHCSGGGYYGCLKAAQTHRLDAMEAVNVFNRAVEAAEDDETRDRLELAREFFTNPEFRRQLSDFVWEINQSKTSA